MGLRLPLLVLSPEQRQAWQTLLAGRDTDVWWVDLPDPRTDPDQALRRWAELEALWGDQTLDALTGLPGRRRVLFLLEDQISRADPSALWVAMVNIDNFQRIQDNFGVETGEAALGALGRLIRERWSEGVAGRLGGDTFLVALRGEPEPVRAQLEALKQAFREQEPVRFVLTWSAGLSRYRPGEGVDEWLDRAERNLYAAKNRGRNTIVEDREFAPGANPSDTDLELADFENRIQVFTDRLLVGLKGRGRWMVEPWKEGRDHDLLTGLFARRYFDRRLVREVQRSRKLGSPLTLALMEVLELDPISETGGQAAADLALKTAAGVLSRGIRVVDWAARFSLHSFCAVFPDTPSEVVATVTDRIRQQVSDHELFTVDGRPFRTTVRFGIVTLSEEDGGITPFLARLVTQASMN